MAAFLELFYLLLSITCYEYVTCTESCVPSIETMGYTIPRGDITVRYGNPLNIYCILSKEKVDKIGPNASQHLTFWRNSLQLSTEMVSVINSSTVKLHVDKPAKSKNENYYCIFKNNTGHTSVCHNVVSVGEPPQPVVDFKCRSYNLDNLTCTWTGPENYVHTDYNLSYSTEIVPHSNFDCPKIDELEEGSSKMSCTWRQDTKPIYRSSLRDFYFFLDMSNYFGNYKMNPQHFEHYKYVIFNAPGNLTVEGKSWNSIRLSWKVPTTVFPPGFHHRILYQSAFGKKEWHSRPIIKTNHAEADYLVHYDLDNLEFAHCLYDIRVSLRSALADPLDESLWSNYAPITVLTASKKPDAPPKTNIGSFEFLSYDNNSYRNVRIYWSDIPEERRNGENLTYVVNLDGSGNDHKTTVNAYMVFKGLSPFKSFTFYIYARNEMGFSTEQSVVRVPAARDCPRGPHLIKTELGGGNYSLSWERPKLEKHQFIQNYTIFWCIDERDRPPCTGKLDWKVVPGNQTSYNQTILSIKTYQFAISVNTRRGSSGMTWAQCTDRYHTNSVGKINAFWWDNFESNFIRVRWNFGCSHRSVTGFIIYYCPKQPPAENILCKEQERNVTVSSNVNNATIVNLIPYTTYRMQIAAIINHTTYSERSEILLSTTSEAAPSTPPSHLKLTNVTNSTVTITWDAPTETNGKLKYFKVFYNNETKQIDVMSSVMLTDLISYTKYDISMQACTVACSESSRTLRVETKIGHPSVIQKPYLTQNATYTSISWEKPLRPNGRNDLYQLRLKEKRDSENFTSIINTTEREWGIYSCGKERKYNSFFVSVRAINVDNNETYLGNWSDEVESYCTSPSNFIVYILVPVIILFFLGMTYLFKAIYNYCKEMRDVGVKLPQGLQGGVTEIDINLTSWPEKPGCDDNDHNAADDEEHLLMKKNEGSPNLNGDSSGCSSAHESVTCSVDTASNISSSTSDSGTEQPRTPSADDPVEQAVTTSLRQRNIRPSSTASKPYVSLPSDSSHSMGMKSAPKSYCVLGVDPNVSDGTSTYISIPVVGDKSSFTSESSRSPPYVVTGELVKTVNPSYIPHTAMLHADSSAKNPAYVVAGNTDILPPNVLNMDTEQSIAPQDRNYTKCVENLILKNADMSSWQPPSLSTNTKTGYVSIGEGAPNKKDPKYVPHRQFESKALKED